MRYALIALGTATCLGLHHAATTPSLDEEAALAIELRCAGQSESVAENCRELHQKLYLAGSLDPDRSLRDYCTPVRTRERIHRRPPAVCVDRFGGWRSEPAAPAVSSPPRR